MRVPIAKLENVSKRYGNTAHAVWALRDVSLTIEVGKFIAVIGPSGSGKTTLLNMIAGLDAPTTGNVLVEGRTVSSLSAREIARLRRRTVAVIFQFFNLFPMLTAAQNVAFPLRADRMARKEIESRVRRALENVGLGDRASSYPGELSGGEMQRVAIARALATDARLILADEPTGNLDTARGEQILELLKHATEKEGRSVLLVTHNLTAAGYASRLVTLRDGRVDHEVDAPSVESDVIPIVRS